jgi:hypothetical protein
MASELLQLQWAFTRAVRNFLDAVYFLHSDVEITVGDFLAHDGHMDRSCHYIKLAMDLSVFYKGKYVQTYEEFPGWDTLGDIWKRQHPRARWGGDFESKDLGHFSFTYGGRA